MSGVLTAPRPVTLAPAVIARPRLDGLLEVERPLTMVTGPPGAGKTVLLTAFAATHDVAWCSSGERRFNSSRVKAVGRRGSGFFMPAGLR